MRNNAVTPVSVVALPSRGWWGDNYSLATFFGLAYALSWAWLIPLALTGSVVTARTGWPTHFPALIGPLAAAVILTARRDGRPGLRNLAARMLRGRVAPRWWLFAVSPLLVLFTVMGVDAALGQPMPALEDFAVFSGLPAGWGVVAVAAAVLVGGFGEETGWRGYALPQLQRRRSPLVATLIVALLWVGWHAPMFLVVDTYRSFGLAILAGWIIAFFSGAIVLSWLYNRSGNSILLVAVWHTTYNLISGTAAAKGLLAAASTTLVIVFAMVLVVVEIRAMRRGNRTILGPRTAVNPDNRAAEHGVDGFDQPED
jgi:membrane protease YdiL (CAAX protease family)